MIGIKSLDKYFNKGKQNEIHVIDDVSLQLPERGMVAIFGRSGCGKTTLLNVIGGLDGFSGGELTVEGNDIRKNTDDVRNRYMGYIFQNYNLNKEETCFDNVADALRLCGMTDRAEIERRVMAALKNVGMDKYRLRSPDTLSGGQQQRIAIARAIVKNPRIILADEPTGNLDEANTVVIMELLKQISREHLVLLVTHEANLVDYYCDKIVELSDGKVVNVRDNESAHGYTARDKNDIFLGELNKSELKGESAEIEYYGDSPQTPIKLKIVNSGGKTYIRIDTPKVHVLDESSEVRLREGVFEQKENKNEAAECIDMSQLPPIESEKCGRLFTAKNAIKTGYKTNFKKGKKGKGFLRVCLGLFAAVCVLVSAFFGTAFSDLKKARQSYNHNVFYVYTPNGEVSQALVGSVGASDSGIDFVRLDDRWFNYSVPAVQFYTGFFETFSSSGTSGSLESHLSLLDDSLCGDLQLVVGKKTNLDTYDMVITTAVADKLLENPGVSYIKEYEDLLGLVADSFSIDGQRLRIAGIVRSSGFAGYVSQISMAKYALAMTDTKVYRASEYGLNVDAGKAVLYVSDWNAAGTSYDITAPLKVHGKDFNVDRIIRRNGSYSAWLEDLGIQLKDKTFDERVERILAEKGYIRPADDTSVEYTEYTTKYYEIYNEQYFDFYDEYWARYDEYLASNPFFDGYEYWLAKVKGSDEAKLYLMVSELGLGGMEHDLFYRANQIKKETGKYPLRNILESAYYNNDDTVCEAFWRVYTPILNAYRDEYNRYVSASQPASTCCFVCDSDYVALSKQIGETSAAVNGSYAKEDNVVIVTAAVSAAHSDNQEGEARYTLVYSSDVEKTAKYLGDKFASLKGEDNYYPAVITPDGIYDNIISQNRLRIIRNVIALAVTLVFMCVCMYFIMRSSLMVRIKEVGVFRAIGVSKKNLLFKFLIETLVLTTLTVFIGYIIMTAFMAVVSSATLMSSILYYPWWLALCVLAVLYGASILCGLLPVMMLLHKSPSAILAKYDI